MLCFCASLGFAQTYTAHRNIQYANVAGISLQVDIYIPNDQAAPTPLIIWVHGGGWQSGTRMLQPNGFQLRQAGRGYAVASITYRLSDEAPFPAQINDVKAAVRWLRANASTYNLNPNKFAAWGSSAGGHLVSLLGTSSALGVIEDKTMGNPTQSSKVQAVVDWYGPTDLLRMDIDNPCPGSNHNSPTSPESEFVGCPIQICRARSRRPNPIRYIDPTIAYPPFLIMHGMADCNVNMQQSQLLYNALTAIGSSAQIKFVEGEGHGGPLFNTAENQALVDAFLDSNLRGVSKVNEKAAGTSNIF
jgi:acetyl esterase/lipase